MFEFIVVDIQYTDIIVMSVNWEIEKNNSRHLGILRIQKEKQESIISEFKSLRDKGLIKFKDDYLLRREKENEEPAPSTLNANALLKTFTKEQLLLLLKGK